MKTERLEKIKKANKNNYSYDAVRDEKIRRCFKRCSKPQGSVTKEKTKIIYQ